jgi:GcrA cell cycle regulator
LIAAGGLMTSYAVQDRRDEIRAYIKANYLTQSNAQIAAVFGVTKNTIVGHLSRMKLHGKRNGTPRRPQNHRKRDAEAAARRAAKPLKPKPTHRGKDTNTPRMATHPPATAPLHVEPTAATNITIMELTDTTCRWPLGMPKTPEFLYCGARADNIHGQPYCGYHTRCSIEPRRK